VRDVLPSPWDDVVLWRVTMGPFWLMLWWLWRRDRHQTVERQRQYAVQPHVWEMERQIWDDCSPTRRGSGNGGPVSA
jgi:hypothetical protein